jgi:hypothetical protein
MTPSHFSLFPDISSGRTSQLPLPLAVWNHQSTEAIYMSSKPVKFTSKVGSGLNDAINNFSQQTKRSQLRSAQGSIPLVLLLLTRSLTWLPDARKIMMLMLIEPDTGENLQRISFKVFNHHWALQCSATSWETFITCYSFFPLQVGG